MKPAPGATGRPRATSSRAAPLEAECHSCLPRSHLARPVRYTSRHRKGRRAGVAPSVPRPAPAAVPDRPRPGFVGLAQGYPSPGHAGQTSPPKCFLGTRHLWSISRSAPRSSSMGFPGYRAPLPSSDTCNRKHYPGTTRPPTIWTVSSLPTPSTTGSRAIEPEGRRHEGRAGTCVLRRGCPWARVRRTQASY